MQVGSFKNDGSMIFNITGSNQGDNLHAEGEKIGKLSQFW